MPDAATTEVLNDVYDAFVDSDLDRVGRRMTDDVVAVDPPEVVDGGTFEGRDAVLGRLAGFLELFDEIELEGLALEDVGDHVLASFTARARAQMGGAQADLAIVHLIRMRDEKVAELRVFFDESAARRFATT